MTTRQLRKHYLFVTIVFGLLAGAFRGSAQEQIKISHGPYLQAMWDSGVSIVWTTNKPATAWVELAPGFIAFSSRDAFNVLSHHVVQNKEAADQMPVVAELQLY